ncbi:MAG: hypothetical protein ACFB51_02180 [Anaerolineae bacterium]
MTDSAAHRLAAQHIQPKFLQENLKPDVLHRGVLAFEAGVQHFAGEQIVAFVDDSEKEAFDLGAILTDRRLLHRQPKGTHQLAYSAMAGPIKVNNSMVTNRFVEVNGQRMVMWNAKPVGAVLEALLNLPPDQRTGPVIPVVTPTDADPTGIRAAMDRGEGADPRVRVILALLDRRVQAGALDAAASRPLVGSAALLARTLRFGRGMHEGYWTTTFSLTDLEGTVGALFGDPFAERDAESGARVLGFDLGGGGRRAAKAAASSAAGLAATAHLGFGWVSLPGKSIRQIRLTLAETHPVAGYRLDAMSGSDWVPAASIPNDGIGPKFAHAVSQSLLKIELLMLLGRALYGNAYTALRSDNRAQVETDAGALLGQSIDLTGFYA